MREMFKTKTSKDGDRTVTDTVTVLPFKERRRSLAKPNYFILFGAEGGSRTPMRLPSPDFESIP